MSYWVAALRKNFRVLETTRNASVAPVANSGAAAATNPYV